MKNIKDEVKHPALITHSLTKICDRGHKICKGFGMKLVSESENLKFEAGSDCYNLIDEMDRIVGKIVPRLVEDEIWYGVNENFSSGQVTLESRGKWLIENTVYDFYNIDCETYV